MKRAHLPVEEYFCKVASASLDEETQQIFKQIYDENPSYWPYGISIKGHKHLYLIKDSTTGEFVGFVGLQVESKLRGEKRIRIGYYTIGVLQKCRGLGIAKESIKKIIKSHADEFDTVEANIVSSNAASKALADSLGITYHESF